MMKTLKIILPVLVLIGIGVGAVIFWPHGRAEQEGPATVADAGVLEIDGVRHRLPGIVPPRPDQQCVDRQGQTWPCGQEAMQALRKLITGTPVLCRPRPDSDDLSDCFVSGKPLTEAMVRQGWAVACRSGRADYSGDERNARFLMLGLWRGGFDPSGPPDGCQ